MKKSIAIIGILACVFGLCACGTSTKVVEPLFSEEQAVTYGVGTANAIIEAAATGQESLLEPYGEVVMNGVYNYESALEDIGTCTGIISTTTAVDDKEAVITVNLGGTSHDAVMEIILVKEGYSSISTTVTYSTSELMGKAGLNTLIGMGTVFCVLILISLIISLFNLIPKIQAAFDKKNKEAAKDIKSEAVDNTIAQIIEKEELSDDLELVAVIAAAIAASEGQASTDGFVVRSIRKRA